MNAVYLKASRNAAAILFLLAQTLPASAQSRTGDEIGGDVLQGAASGAIIGAIAGDAGKGAAAGAVGGALFGGTDRILPDNPGGDMLRGAAIGGVAGNAGKGAAAGVLLGGIKRNW